MIILLIVWIINVASDFWEFKELGTEREGKREREGDREKGRAD